jgi:hypothetical protein
VIPVLLGFVSLVFWVVAGFLAAAGVSLSGKEGAWAVIVFFFLAGLAAYPAWLFARAAMRIARSSANSDAALRRYAVQDMLIWALPFGVMFWLLTGSVFLGGLFGFVAFTARGLRAVQEFERPPNAHHPALSQVSNDREEVPASLRLAARAKALLLTDARDFHEGMARRRMRRFHRHPFRMHLLYAAGYLLAYAALWYVAGPRPALVILSVTGVLFAANVLAAGARRLRRR